MKNIILICAIVLLPMTIAAQKVTTMEATTTANVASIIKECQLAGKKAGYGTRELDSIAGTIVLWKEIGNVGQQLIITASVKKQENDNTVRFVINHIHGNIDNYRKRLEAVIKQINLPDFKPGKYVKDIE
jgi:hypothetical protein